MRTHWTRKKSTQQSDSGSQSDVPYSASNLFRTGQKFQKTRKEQMKGANFKKCASFAVEITLQLDAILLKTRM